MLLEVVERLRDLVPEVFVLVAGPSRGYVRTGLERLGIPYRHVHLPDVDDLPQAYDAVDVCLVTSRDEGGPRAVLEAMATGVPLVTTRVGQASDLVRHGENGWMVDVDDVDGLVEWTAHVAFGERDRAARGAAGRAEDRGGELVRGAPAALALALPRLRRAARRVSGWI